MKKFILIKAKAFLLSLLLFVSFNFSFAQWQPDVRLTSDAANSYTSMNNAWSVAASGNVVHVVWEESRDGNTEIYYKRSLNGGINWGADIRLTNNTGGSSSPSIAVSDSSIHVVWYDSRDGGYEIYYKRSIDGGGNWGPDTRLTNNSATSWYPSIAVNRSLLNVVWSDFRDGNYEIYSMRSSNNGVNWSTENRLTNNSSESSYPSVAIADSLVHVAWRDNRDGNFETYYKVSTDGGAVWGADTRLSNDPAYSYFPTIAASGSNVHVVWEDYRINNNFQLYYKRSTDKGVSWGAETRLTLSNYQTEYPSIALSGNFLHLVWFDGRDGNTEIYYKRSSDQGVNWGTDTRLTNNTAYSQFPSIAVSGALVNVVWTDKRDGNPEVYYKRNPAGNVGVENISTEIPSTYSLSQNFPNPFNPVTNVKFSIVKAGQVNLIVYDAMGREVETLVNERLQTGTYETSFNGSMLNSGVYFYKLITDGFTETKKMILIK